MNDIWQSWEFIRKKAYKKEIVFFGRSDDWIEKNYVQLKGQAKCIVDNNPQLHGSNYRELEILKPDDVLPDKNVYVVITSGSYTGICEQLLGLGLQPGHDFCCTPYITDLQTINDIQEHELNLLITIPDHHNKRTDDDNKGGIYLLKSKDSIKKVITGLFRQICNGPGCYFAIDHYEGICCIDNEFKFIKKQKLDGNSQPHGIGFCPRRNLLFVANTGLDKVTIHDGSSLEKIDDLFFSPKAGMYEIEQHHINDLCVDGDFLYVSYFSKSGNYRRGVIDGGIDQFLIDNLSEGRETVAKDLWFPHSVKVINGNICYLDTMRGDFYVQSNVVAGNFPGFMRGLSYDGRYYIIGQSVNTYAGKLKGLSNNIMFNAGVYVFDIETKGSFFHSLDGVIDIHDVFAI